MIKFIKNIFSSKKNPEIVELDSSSELLINSEAINTSGSFKNINEVEKDLDEIERIVNEIAIAEVNHDRSRKT